LKYAENITSIVFKAFLNGDFMILNIKENKIQTRKRIITKSINERLKNKRYKVK
jgi:hypothetical protein